MNKNDLIDAVAERTSLAKSDAARAVEALADQRAVNGLLDGLYRAARAAPDAEQGIADDTRRDAGVERRCRRVGGGGPTEQLVAEDLLTGVQDRLAGDVDLFDGDGHPTASSAGRRRP